MSTGKPASKDLFERLIALGKRHNILIINDNPYSFILHEYPQSIMSIDDAMDTAFGTAQNVTDTWIADNDLHVTSYSSAITIAGSPVAGELVKLQLSRDTASDTLGVDAEVVSVLIEYSTNASNSS